MNQLKKRINNLEDVIDIQCSNGNWNYDPYMQGMANGLLLAHHIITGYKGELIYLEAPKKWLKDYPTLWTKIKWKLFGFPKPVTQNEPNQKISKFLKSDNTKSMER